MQAFLYINLTATTPYHQPVPEQVKKALPQIAVLDVDAASGELVQHYALRLLRDAAKAVVCIKADESVADISALMPFLEELFQEHPQRHVLLQGQHDRLQRMFAARPAVSFKVVGEEEVLEEVEQFLQNS